MKKILMIATGGTIASRNTGEGLTPVITPHELLEFVPEIAQMCDVETVQPFNLDSTNVYYPHWLGIARLVRSNYAEYDGFVVTHGTDTMAYTAAALSYLIQNSAKPVVLTGSQKSVYLRDTDARGNLADAFAYCADDRAYGVRVVFDGKVILGTRAKKTRTRSYNAFSSIDFPEIAVIRDGKVVYYSEPHPPAGEPLFSSSLDPEVFVLKTVPGMRADIFDYLEKVKPGHGGEIQLTDALQAMAKDRGMMAVRMAGMRFDAGDWSEFLTANSYFALQDEDLRYELLAQLRKFVQFQ